MGRALSSGLATVLATATGTLLIPDRLLFRPDVSPVGTDRTSVMRCRRSLTVRHWLLLLLSLIWEELQYLVRLVLDGCFWHGCPEHLRPAKINESFRSTKDRGNRQRDQDADRQLAEAGRTVVRVWEHEDPQTAARRIAEVVGGLSMDRTSLKDPQLADAGLRCWNSPRVEEGRYGTVKPQQCHRRFKLQLAG